MNQNIDIVPKWDNNVVVLEDDSVNGDDDMNAVQGSTFEIIENMNTVIAMEQDEDNKTCSIDIWEHVDSSIHTVLLKEVWMAKTEDDMVDALNRLWSSCIATKDTIVSLTNIKLLEDDTSYIRNDNEIEIFYTLGGYSIIVGIMNKYHNHEIIQEMCCLLLGVICKNHTELICHSLYADVVRCIVRCMIKFPNCNDIQLNALYALNTLSEHNNYDACTKIMGLLDDTISEQTNNNNNDKNNDKSNVTGLQVIIIAMKTYPNIYLLQYYGCSILYNLTFDDYLIDIRTVGAMGVLAAAMETHPLHSNIQDMARNAMMELL